MNGEVERKGGYEVGLLESRFYVLHKFLAANPIRKVEN